MSSLSLPALLLFLIATLVPLEQADAADVSLKLLWSKPVAAGYRAPGIILSNRIEAPDDFIGFYATGGLLTAPDESGPGPTVSLKNLKVKSRTILAAARGLDDTYWLGGKRYGYFSGGDFADAFLARVDGQGRVITERTYRSWLGYRQIQKLLPLDTGELIIAENAKLVKVSERGRVLWEIKLKPTKEIALSRIGHRIIVATIERDTENNSVKDNVVVRVLGTDGKTHAARIIRTSINEEAGSYYGNLQITASNDGAYVSSNWVDFLKAQPVEITKISASGNIVWQKNLVSSIAQNPNQTWATCKPEQTILANGSLLVACALKGEVWVYLFDARTGDLDVRSTALPECHKNGIADLFLTQRKNGKIWLFGSRPGNGVGPSCTWLGELVLE
jgi:hypothetical protein